MPKRAPAKTSGKGTKGPKPKVQKVESVEYGFQEEVCWVEYINNYYLSNNPALRRNARQATFVRLHSGHGLKLLLRHLEMLRTSVIHL